MKLKELFKNKSTWIQNCLAHNKNGDWVREDSEEAVAWCLAGGMIKCYGYMEPEVAGSIMTELGLSYDVNIVDWNNNKNRKFSDIKRLVNKLDI